MNLPRTSTYIVAMFLLVACGGGDLDVVNNETASGSTDDEPQGWETEDPGDETEDDETPTRDEPIGEEDPDVIVSSDVPNHAWIGGSCASAGDCDYDGAVCLGPDGHPGGQCSLPCDRICPDRDGENSVTFCVEKAGEGMCASQCDFDLYPEAGCRDGYSCRVTSRFGEPGTQRAACLPGESENPEAVTPCLRALDEAGIIWASWNYQTQYDGGLACTIDDPIRVSSPINGVQYRYYNQDTAGTMSMSCEMALALHRLGDVMAEHDLTDLLHIGTFNCRKIGGSSRLSQHSFGNAIDIWGFEDAAGERYILEEHWEHNTTNPSGPKGKVLYDVAQAMHDEQIFNIVLTPNYNAAHDNHFHVDLTQGSNFIGSSLPPEYYLGGDPKKWAEHCGGD